MKPTRHDFLTTAAAAVGSPYCWGGKGDLQWTPQQTVKLPYLAFDCLGLVLWALWRAGGPDIRLKHNTDTFLAQLRQAGAELRELDQLRPGDLLFFGGPPDDPDDVDHVEIYADSGQLLGARGGGRHTLTLTAAVQRGAKVGFQPLSAAGRPVRALCSLSPYLAD